MRPQIPSLGELPPGRERTDALRAEYSSPKLLSEMSERAMLGSTGTLDADELPAALAELQEENHRLSLLVIETRNTPRESVNVAEMLERQGAEVVELNDEFNVLSKNLASKRKELNALQLSHPELMPKSAPAPSLAELSGTKKKKPTVGGVEDAAMSRLQENLRARGQEQREELERDNARVEEIEAKTRETLESHEHAKHYQLVLKYMETLLRLEKPEKERAKTRLVEEIEEVDGDLRAGEQRLTTLSAEVEHLKLEKGRVMKGIMELRAEHASELAHLEGQLTSRRELSKVFKERDGNRGEIKKEVRGDLTKKEEEELLKKRRKQEVKMATTAFADGSEQFKHAEHMHRGMSRMLSASGCEEPLELLDRIQNREQLQRELEEQAKESKERKHELADELRAEQRLLDQIKYAGFSSVMERQARDDLEHRLNVAQARASETGTHLRTLVQKKLQPVSVGLQDLNKRLVEKLQIVGELKFQVVGRLPSLTNKFAVAGRVVFEAGALANRVRGSRGSGFNLDDMFDDTAENSRAPTRDGLERVDADEGPLDAPQDNAEAAHRAAMEDDVTIKVDDHGKIIKRLIKLQATADMVARKLGEQIKQRSENSYESVLARLPTPTASTRIALSSRTHGAMQKARTKINSSHRISHPRVGDTGPLPQVSRPRSSSRSSRSNSRVFAGLAGAEDSLWHHDSDDDDDDVADLHRVAKKEINDKLRPATKPLRRGQVPLAPSRKSSKKSL